MKRTAALSIIIMLLASSVLKAETAYWFISDSEDYILRTGDRFSDYDLIGKSNAYPIGSVVDISSADTGKHAIITIADRLDDSFGIMDIALSAGAMQELGIFGKGHGEVTVSMIREGDSFFSPEAEGSGWFLYDCGTFSSAEECYLIYSRLLRNGLKPAISIEDGLIHLTVPHIREHQKADTEKKMALSGIDKAELKGEENPYLR